MTRLKLVSTKISADWVDRLEESTRLTGLTQSAIVRLAIGQYLGLETVNPVDLVDPLRSELDELKERVQSLEESRLTVTTSSTPPTPPPPPPIAMAKASTPNPPIAAAVVTTKKTSMSPTGLMRSGELFTALQARGYTRSAGSLLRDLNESIEMQAPNKELARFGVRCDFEAKRSANPRSSNLRWLSIE